VNFAQLIVDLLRLIDEDGHVPKPGRQQRGFLDASDNRLNPTAMDWKNFRSIGGFNH